MSNLITEAFVQQYKSNVFHLSQQKSSRLRGTARNESQKGKRAFYDRIGLTEAVLKTSRHADTVYADTPHSRRAVDMNDYTAADLIDDEDKIRMLIDPASAYVQSFASAFGRKMDSVLIAAARGNAYSGENGATTVALPATQKVLAAASSAPGTPTRLNIDTLRKVQFKFDEADVDPMLPRYFAFTAKQKQDLLASTEITSSDYNTVKALVAGQIDTFMGFKFIHTQLLPLEVATYNASTGVIDSGGESISATYARRCLAWCGDGLILAVGQDIEAKIEKLPTKNYSTQVFTRMTVGATRLEEAKVVEIVCDESVA
jgi:hypothetical protein